MEATTKPSDEIPKWAYMVGAGVAIGVGTVATIVGAWCVRRRVKLADVKKNEMLRQSEHDGNVESLKARTPRE